MDYSNDTNTLLFAFAMSDLKKTISKCLILGHDDNLRCFYCDGNLRRWKRGEDPFHKHEDYFPHCSYIKAERRRQNTGSENDVNLPQTRSNAGITDPSNHWNHPETPGPRTNMNHFGSYRPTVHAATGKLPLYSYYFERLDNIQSYNR